MAIAVAICTDHVLWGAGTPRTLRTFMRWVYLCIAGYGNHVLLDEAKVTHQALRRSALALRGAWPGECQGCSGGTSVIKDLGRGVVGNGCSRITTWPNERIPRTVEDA